MSNKEAKEVINLSGQICPFPVMRIVRDADMLPKGESATFLVDDPLAIKAIPEEFEDFNDFSTEIKAVGNQWEITVSRDEE